MPPQAEADTSTTGVLYESDVQTKDGGLDREVAGMKYAGSKKYDLVYANIIWFILLHIASLYALYVAFADTMWQTNVFAFVCYLQSGMGITAGVHRLWAHKAFKAKWPLRLTLMLWNTMAFQDSVIDWARDHRVHHKYSDTDADPHNAVRGFFFAHVGWLCCRKSDQVKAKGQLIDMSDLENDPILAFQKKYYMKLMPLVCFILPTVIPVYGWDESWANAFLVPTLLRYAIVLNATWSVNSFAHFFGHRPYDNALNPRENLGVACVALGEGFHNFHHTFPWDYKSSELPFYTLPNPSSAFIDFMAYIGQASDLKTVSNAVVRRRAKRTGDGTHKIWGWDDTDLTAEFKKDVTIHRPTKAN
uniref:Acyl-CoA delta-9 desaturase isoform n=1 Tax=Thitarodes pui TaxID=507567 RepID=D2KCJ1_THIPU|nr:acyl-CoA delta-9 desaturase isoform [Thitarodes pui]